MVSAHCLVNRSHSLRLPQTTVHETKQQTDTVGHTVEEPENLLQELVETKD